MPSLWREKGGRMRLPPFSLHASHNPLRKWPLMDSSATT